MKFKDQDLSGITTVDQLQAAMRSAGINPFQYVIWHHQRPLWSPMGSYQVTPVEAGYRVDSIDRGSVVDEGTFSDQAAVVRYVLDTSDPVPPQTPEQRASVMAAGARDRIERADERARIAADIDAWLEEERQRDAVASTDPADGFGTTA